MLTRKIGESIILDGNITITGIDGNKVRIGVEAPKEVKVFREEIIERIKKGSDPFYQHQETSNTKTLNNARISQTLFS